MAIAVVILTLSYVDETETEQADEIWERKKYVDQPSHCEPQLILAWELAGQLLIFR